MLGARDTLQTQPGFARSLTPPSFMHILRRRTAIHMAPLRFLTQIAPGKTLEFAEEQRMGDIVYIAMTAAMFIVCVLAITVVERM